MIRDDGKLWPEEGDRIVSPSGEAWDITYKGPRERHFGAVAELERVDDMAHDTIKIGEVQQRVQRGGWTFDREHSNDERSRIDVYHERALRKRAEVSD